MAQKTYPTIGFFIIAQREKTGLSQLDYAREVGISKNTLAKMEKDQGASPQAIKQLAKYLGMTDWRGLVRSDKEYSRVEPSQPKINFAVHAVFFPPNETPADSDPLLQAIKRIISTRPDIMSVTFTREDNSMWVGGELNAEWTFAFLQAFADGLFESIDVGDKQAAIDVLHLPKESIEATFVLRHPDRPKEMPEYQIPLSVHIAFSFPTLEATMKEDGSMELRRVVQVPEPVTV